MENLTIPARLQYWTEKMPDLKVFTFVHPGHSGVSMTMKEVSTLSRRFAGVLQKHGLQKGDVVCSTLPNCPERVICDFGVITAGGVTVPGFAVLADGSDIVHNLQTSKSRFLIVNDGDNSAVWNVLKTKVEMDESGTVTSKTFPHLERVLFINLEGTFLKSLVDDTFIPVCLQPSDLATILNTAGSTGYSKLVSTTHERIFHFSRAYVKMHNLDSTKTIYRDRPLGWSGGFPFFCLEGPARQFILDERFPKPDDLVEYIWKLICREKIFTLFNIPPFVLALLGRDDLLKDSGWMLDNILVAGQCVKRNIAPAIGKVCRSFGVAYGSTEAGIICHEIYTSPEKVLDYNVGRILLGVQVKIVDDDLNQVKNGVQGQLVVKSPGCFTEYYQNPEATIKAFTSDGWFLMDDTGYMDDEERVFVQGRQSDLIMKGINKVYPAWLEAKILTSPMVRDVAVVPVPDDVYVNEICACVIPKENGVNPDELRQLCIDLFRSPGQNDDAVVPKYYLIMKDFPSNSFGKTDKKAIKEMARDLIQKQNT